MSEKANFLSNSLVSKKANYHYWFTPKCACTTTKNLLWEAEAKVGNCNPIDDANYVHVRQLETYSPWYVDGAEIEKNWKTDGRFTFTFVRNPFARALSAYQSVTATPSSHAYFSSLGWKNDQVPSFSEFLRLISVADPRTLDHHWRPLTKLVPIVDVNFDYIGRVENYEGDLRTIVRRAFNRDIELNYSQKNYFTGAGSRDLDGNSIDMIREIYKDDFSMFRYSTDPHSRRITS